MAHGLNPVLKRPPTAVKGTDANSKTGIGSRRIFAPHFKLQVLDSYRNDADCKGNQRATARKYGIHRRQIQKWLQCENVLRNSVSSKIKSNSSNKTSCDQQQPTAMMPEARKCGIELALRGGSRQRDDCCGLEAGGCAAGGGGGAGHQQGALRQQQHRCCSEMDARVPTLSPSYNHHQHSPSPTAMANECCNGYQMQAAATAAAVVPVIAAVPRAAAAASPVSSLATTATLPQTMMIPTTISSEAPPSPRWPATSCGEVSATQPVVVHAAAMAAVAVPASLSPLDFTVRSRASLAADPVAPMDLSFKPRRPSVCGGSHQAPVGDVAAAPMYYGPPASLQPLSQQQLYPALATSACAPSPLLSPMVGGASAITTHQRQEGHHQSHTEVWDLSTKSPKRKYEEETDNSCVQKSPSSASLSPKSKPVKLFKPYLDDLHDENGTISPYEKEPSRDREPVIVKNESFIPCCNAYLPPESETHYFNNNHIITTEYSYSFPEYSPPKAYHVYPVEEAYMYRGPECDISHLCSYEEGRVLHPVPLKQRQSYSLDFKLSAIECYYQDTMCKGNQRAVANKYNIHRRQVQKWLKQEEELRQKNESFKPIHAVR